MNKVIFVVLDGLNYEVGSTCLGFTMAQVEQGKGKLYKVTSELPSMSRPLYECLMTGVEPVKSGVFNNDIVRLSNQESIFSVCKKNGKVTAASAYHWVSELYNRAPWDPVLDRHVNDSSLNIAHGIFYQWDDYPDEAVINDAEFLRVTYDPDFLLIHPMNVDDTGHKYGGSSSQYRNKARKVDIYLSRYLNTWIELGYQVIITADHGMNDDMSHGGVLKSEREVPFYVFGERFSFDECQIKQTEICGNILELLDVSHNKTVSSGLIKK